MGYTRKKKSVHAQETCSDEVAEERHRFQQQEQPALPAGRLHVLDETGLNLAMTPRYTRSPLGQRAEGHAPFQRGLNCGRFARHPRPGDLEDVAGGSRWCSLPGLREALPGAGAAFG